MKYYLFMNSPMLRAPAPDGDGSDAGIAAPEPIEDTGMYDEEESTVESPATVETPEEATPNPTSAAPVVEKPAVVAPVVAPAKPPAGTLSEADVKAIAELVRKNSAPAPAAPAAPVVPKKLEEKKWDELTPEEFAQRSKRLVITPQHMAAAGFPDATPEQMRGMQDMFDGVSEHAWTMANAVIDEKVAQLREELTAQVNPLIDSYAKYQDQQLKDNFFASHPDLVGHDEIIKEVAKSIGTKNPDGTPIAPQQILATLATYSRAVIAQRGGQPATQIPPGTPSAQRPSTVPRPASLPTAARSGHVQSGNPVGEPKTPGDADIYN